MSFRFKQQTITLDNYRVIFSTCTPDILDEIRSAILDDTPIANFISCCGDDDYKLGQFRKAIRELVPTEFLNHNFTGNIIRNIRKGLSKGYDMDELLKYANNKGLFLDIESLEIISDFLSIGTNLSSVDFNYVPKSQVEIVCKGLYNQYPMWLLVNKDSSLSDSQLELLIRGMQLGIDVHPFLNGSWNDNVLVILFSNANKININKLLTQISSRFTVDELRVLIELVKSDIPIDRLCIKDNEGYPVYNCYQMEVLGQAIKEGLDVEKMFNPNLSDMDMQSIMEVERKYKNRKLKVSL